MNYLSEGFGQSALKAFRVFKDIAGKFDKSGGAPYMKGSIAEYSKELIMTFPMMCDDSLPIETASMISRANERHIITLLQLLFASEQMNGKGGIDVISKIHKNIKSNMTMDDYIEIVDDIGSTMRSFGEAQEIARAERVMTESLKNNNAKSYPVNSFSENSLNDYAVRNDYYGRTAVMEARPIRLRYGKNFPQTKYIDLDKAAITGYADDGKPIIDLDKLDKVTNIHDRENRRLADIKKAKEEKERADRDYKLRSKQVDMQDQQFNRQLAQQQNQFNTNMANRNQQFAMDYALRQQRATIDQNKYALDYAAALRQRDQAETEFFQKRLLDTEVKKCNEMSPSLMVIKYIMSDMQDPTTRLYAEKPFIAGVKSRLIPVDSMDIVDRLVAKNRTKLSFVNFIRATTGEIGFIKDFLFSLDQAKIDAKNGIKKGPSANMWKTLEFRASKNQKNKLRRAGNDASAITTLVINQETVNFMKKNNEFDIENIKNTRMIMDAFNLLGVIICDESIQAAKFFYAGNDTWETQAYAYLEKESNDKSYKKVISLISSMNGR